MVGCSPQQDHRFHGRRLPGRRQRLRAHHCVQADKTALGREVELVHRVRPPHGRAGQASVRAAYRQPDLGNRLLGPSALPVARIVPRWHRHGPFGGQVPATAAYRGACQARDPVPRSDGCVQPPLLRLLRLEPKLKTKPFPGPHPSRYGQGAGHVGCVDEVLHRPYQGQRAAKAAQKDP